MKKLKSKLTYGINKNELVHISKVVSGLNCNCVCPNPDCNGKLIARRGENNADHFAHYNLEDCGGAIESALHLLAKEIIRKSKIFKIPALIGTDLISKRKAHITQARTMKIDNVDLEVNYGNVRPDVVLTLNGKLIFVEIAVTHFVDEEKLKKIRELNIPLIEIDLSHLRNGFNKKELQATLIDSDNYKKWLYSNREKELAKKHFDRENLRIKRQKKVDDNKIEWIEYRRKKAMFHGYSIIRSGMNRKFCCPKILSELLPKNVFQHKIFYKLKNQGIWDGVVAKTKSGANYVRIDGEDYFFSPGYELSDLLNIEDRKKHQRIWAILTKLSDKSMVSNTTCESCQFFEEYVVEKSELTCKFKN